MHVLRTHVTSGPIHSGSGNIESKYWIRGQVALVYAMILLLSSHLNTISFNVGWPISIMSYLARTMGLSTVQHSMQIDRRTCYNDIARRIRNRSLEVPHLLR